MKTVKNSLVSLCVLVGIFSANILNAATPVVDKPKSEAKKTDKNPAATIALTPKAEPKTVQDLKKDFKETVVRILESKGNGVGKDVARELVCLIPYLLCFMDFLNGYDFHLGGFDNDSVLAYPILGLIKKTPLFAKMPNGNNSTWDEEKRKGIWALIVATAPFLQILLRCGFDKAFRQKDALLANSSIIQKYFEELSKSKDINKEEIASIYAALSKIEQDTIDKKIGTFRRGSNAVINNLYLLLGIGAIYIGIVNNIEDHQLWESNSRMSKIVEGSALVIMFIAYFMTATLTSNRKDISAQKLEKLAELRQMLDKINKVVPAKDAAQEVSVKV